MVQVALTPLLLWLWLMIIVLLKILVVIYRSILILLIVLISESLALVWVIWIVVVRIWVILVVVMFLTMVISISSWVVVTLLVVVALVLVVTLIRLILILVDLSILVVVSSETLRLRMLVISVMITRTIVRRLWSEALVWLLWLKFLILLLRFSLRLEFLELLLRFDLWLEFLELLLSIGLWREGLTWNECRSLRLLNLFLWLIWRSWFRNKRFCRRRETTLRQFQWGGLSLSLELLLVTLLLNVSTLGIRYLLVSTSSIYSCHWFILCRCLLLRNRRETRSCLILMLFRALTRLWIWIEIKWWPFLGIQ